MWRSSVKNALALHISFPKERFTVSHTCTSSLWALLDYSENIACEMADKLFLVVADYNPDAKRFYERNGYQQVGKIPNLYRPGITEYMMAKDLRRK